MLEQRLICFLKAVGAKKATPLQRIFVGVSGGVDSIVLAHALVQTHPQCILVHVHHHLQSAADVWPDFVAEFARAHHVEYIVHHVETVPKAAESIEAFARQARYDFFASLLTSNTDALCLGHHQDDQVETFFLNLVRGAGLNGLTAMPESRPLGQGLLLRPLLACTRAELEMYAMQHQLSWVEDPSNQDQRFDRNFLRETILPLFKQRWPHFQDQVGHTIQHLQESRLILDAHLDVILANAGIQSDVLLHFPLAKIKALPPHYQKILLQHWFKKCTQLQLSRVHLERIIQDFLQTGPDAAPLFEFHGWSLRRNRHDLYLRRAHDNRL